MRVQAMKEEMKTLEKNSIWEIVDRLKDKRYKFDGPLIDTKKDWLLKDYEETFASIAKMNTPPTSAETCNNLMLKMSSFMETWKRKSTWRFP
ncbi:hypothetical protein CR513_05769, partial [Mucuna pruriens]